MMDLSDKYKTVVRVVGLDGKLLDYLANDYLQFLPKVGDLLQLPNLDNWLKVEGVKHNFKERPYSVDLVVAIVPERETRPTILDRMRQVHEENKKKQGFNSDAVNPL